MDPFFVRPLAPLPPTRGRGGFATGDLGPGHPGIAQSGGFSAAQLEHATSDPDPAVALLAEIARTHTRAGARFNTVAFALTPNFAVQPATVTAIVQQILPQNPARKSLIYRETQNVARGNT